MKYIKTLGLLAMAAAALMAFAGVASATTLTAPANTTFTGTIKAHSEGHTILHNAFGTVECPTSEVEGKVEKHGPGVTVKGKLTKLTFTGCTNGHVVHVSKVGELEIHGNGTLTSTGTEVTVTAFGVTCGYTTNATHIGTLTNAASDAGHATLHINSAVISLTHGSFFCGSTATWTGSYKVTTPTGLRVDNT